MLTMRKGAESEFQEVDLLIQFVAGWRFRKLHFEINPTIHQSKKPPNNATHI